MIRKFFKGIVIFGIVFILLSNSVLATSGKVTGNNVRIREKPDIKSKEITIATKNEKVEILDDEGNWYKVKFDTVTGYISKDYVDTAYISSNSNVAQDTTSNQDSESITKPEENTEVQEEAKQEIETTSSENNIQNYEKNQTVTFEKDTKLRYLPNFTSRTCSTASSGSTYTISNVLNNWVKVTNDSNSGWVLKINISETNQEIHQEQENPIQSTEVATVSTSKKGKTNVDSARIRRKPNGEVIDSLKEGTMVEIIDEENEWYHIKVEGYDDCYIAKRLITEF